MSRFFGLHTIILLVSCAHALVHLLEQSIASVEQVICTDFELTLSQSGLLGFVLRLPYGVGALFAGLLADRFGEKRILVTYLLGAGVTCCLFSSADQAGTVYGLLFGLGSFGSMYHPAGLSLLANRTTPATRARALGIHGIFGSLGIATAPFLAGVVLSLRSDAWQEYYLLLGTISFALGLIVFRMLKMPARHAERDAARISPPITHHRFQWLPYALLVTSASLGGTIYGGVLHFLPRYLEEAKVLSGLTGDSFASAGNYASAAALLCGAVGQWTAGRLASPRTLPVQLSMVYLSNVPFLLGMVWAEGIHRLLIAGLWAFFHFMSQPLYNALLAEFMPAGRRSFGFGFSNMMGFGVGAVGPYMIGLFDNVTGDYTWGYSLLASVAVAAAVIPLPLLSSNVAERESESTR